VVNYYVPEDYVHRIEHTDHAVNKGCANPIWSPQLETDDARRQTLRRSIDSSDFTAGFQKRLYRRKQI
jgi:superfamily II DNA/RNA helicase